MFILLSCHLVSYLMEMEANNGTTPLDAFNSKATDFVVKKFSDLVSSDFVFHSVCCPIIRHHKWLAHLTSHKGTIEKFQYIE